MTAPALWIIMPILAGAALLVFTNGKYSAFIGGGITTLLTFIAIVIPIDTALLIGSISIKISPAIQVLGRTFELTTADGPLLVLIYGTASLWFFGSEASGASSQRFVSIGLIIIALLTASIAVEPFLYAALLLEVSAMLVVPLVLPMNQNPGRGVVRFLIYQTLAMPFILFSGWMLAGVEASPGDLGTTIQSGVMLSLGFAFLFSIFPLYNWIPQLVKESSPYPAGFLLWALPVFTTIFALGFLDRYTWLKNSPQFSNAILLSGAIMIASGGLFVFLQRNLGQIFAYASIVLTGMLLLGLGLKSADFVQVIFLALIPRGLIFSVWCLALSILGEHSDSFDFASLQGIGRNYPLATSALVLASLSAAGFPLLAGFPSWIAILTELAAQSLGVALWVFIGLTGFLAAALRSLAVLFMAKSGSVWQLGESWIQTVMLSIGIAGLFILGIFPQIMQPFLVNLPALFEHLQQ